LLTIFNQILCVISRAGYEPFQEEGTAAGNTERASAVVEESTEQERPLPAANLTDSASAAAPNKTSDSTAPPRVQRPENQRPFPPRPENQRPFPPQRLPNNGGGGGSLELPQRPEFLGPEPPPASSTLSLLEQIFGTTTQQSVEIQPSFEPPVLVTPPSSGGAQRRPFVQRPRPPAQRR